MEIKGWDSSDLTSHKIWYIETAAKQEKMLSKIISKHWERGEAIGKN